MQQDASEILPRLARLHLVWHVAGTLRELLGQYRQYRQSKLVSLLTWAEVVCLVDVDVIADDLFPIILGADSFRYNVNESCSDEERERSTCLPAQYAQPSTDILRSSRLIEI